ncbi:ABC-type dipeptide/oligopeptide/nickel transport system ATPase component [Bradyrhizobium sp. LA6.4]
MTAQPLLDVQDLTVEFTTRRGIVKAVQHVNISVAKGETLAIVGESGSGKSVTSYAVMRILDRAGRIAEGSVMFSGIDVKAATEDQMRDLRGREVSMIFQNPRAALNPIRKVGDQIEDVLRTHVQQAMVSDHGEKAIEALEQVKIARPRERYHAYPFELSGGMCQRVVIALALACNPQLLIADEPTTGLDVTTQKAVMDLIVELTKRKAMSTILITHDLGLAAAYCDRVVVMEKGRVVETAKAADIFANPQHPYTKKLMRATPRLGVSLRDLLPEEEGASFASPRVRGEADARSAAGEGGSPSTVLAERGGGAPPPPPPPPPAPPAPPPPPPTLSPQAGRGRRRPSSSSKSSSRNTPARAPRPRSENCSAASLLWSRTCSAPSTASASPSAMARASVWSANPAAANRRRR